MRTEKLTRPENGAVSIRKMINLLSFEVRCPMKGKNVSVRTCLQKSADNTSFSTDSCHYYDGLDIMSGLYCKYKGENENGSRED